MFEKNPAHALSLALEAEHEAEQVHDTYQSLADVLDIEKGLSEVDQANDISEGLESLQIVLESLSELDATDVALIQVLGDIAGATAGVSGVFFTPAMEDMNDDGPSAGDKAKAISARVHEMLKKLYERLVQFAKYIQAKVNEAMSGINGMVEDARAMVGKKISAKRATALKRKLDDMKAFAAALDEYAPIMSWLTTSRQTAVETFLKQGKLVPAVSSDIERIYKRLSAFKTKYGAEDYPSSVKFIVETHDVHDITDGGVIQGFLKASISVRKGTLPVSESPVGEQDVEITPDFGREAEDVIKKMRLFTMNSGASSLREISHDVTRAIHRLSKESDVIDIPNTEGVSVTSLMMYLTSALHRDGLNLVTAAHCILGDMAELRQRLRLYAVAPAA